jgi:hypothetical protein
MNMYNKDNNAPTNSQIRIIYAPGYSYLVMSYFRRNLVLNFVPWLSKNHLGKDEYSKEVFLSTSIYHDSAAFFYLQASRILDGKDSGEPIEVVLPCNNDTTLTFEYRPDENNQMSTYLTINKNNQTIPFRFPTTEYQEKVDGQMVTTVMQTGLGIFSLILGCYITGSAADLYLNQNNVAYNEALQMTQELAQEEWVQEMAAKANNQGQS